MRVHNQKGSKERLFEMFERVNKVKLNEGQVIDQNSTMFQQIKTYLQKNYLTNRELELDNDTIVFFEYEIDDYIVEPYDRGDYHTPPSGGGIEDIKIYFTEIVISTSEDEYPLSDDAVKEINRTFRGIDGKLKEEVIEEISNKHDSNESVVKEELSSEEIEDENDYDLRNEVKNTLFRMNKRNTSIPKELNVAGQIFSYQEHNYEGIYESGNQAQIKYEVKYVGDVKTINLEIFVIPYEEHFGSEGIEIIFRYFFGDFDII